MIKSTQATTPIITKKTVAKTDGVKAKDTPKPKESGAAPQKETMEFTGGAAVVDPQRAPVQAEESVSQQPKTPVESEPPVESAPATLFQEAAPIEQLADAGPVTETQLITQAFESYQKSDIHFAHINETMGQLSPEDGKEAGQHMFYHTASLMPQFKIQNEDGSVTGSTAAQIREGVSHMSVEDRKTFEGLVHQFMADDPTSAQIGVAGGAADFGRERLEGFQADADAGRPVDETKLNQASALYHSGIGYSQETTNFADSINGLFAMDKKETAEAVLNATMFAQE